MTALEALKIHLQDMMQMRLSMIPEGHDQSYFGMEDFVLDRGYEFKSASLTDEEMEIVRRAVQFPGCGLRAKECYYNAQMLALHEPELTYYEGYAFGLIPTPHAWVATKSMKVVDLTWRRTEHGTWFEYEPEVDLSTRVLGEIPEGIAYIGVGFPTEMIREEIFKTESAHSFLDDWRNDFPLLKWPRVSPKSRLQSIADEIGA